MKKLPIIWMIALTFFNSWVKAQEQEKFNGESQLKDCLVDLPLTYMPKEKEQYTERANTLKDKELIFLTFNKKKKTATYKRLYVNVMQGKNGEVVYLETVEDHLKAAGNKQALFTRFYPDKNRYYLAQCFNEKLHNISELGLNIKEE